MTPVPCKLMAVFAHPDDEAFGVGGTLTRYAAEGCDVQLVTATRGEAGQIAESRLATASSLPEVRERELRCACEIYGIRPPRFLDYVDGQLPIVHQGQSVAKLVRIFRDFRPQVVVTFGPEGIYGHYDHIAVHRWATIAYDLAADPDCFPGQLDGTCHPHQVDKLYYQVLSKEWVAAFSESDKPAAVSMDGVDFPIIGYDADQITTIIDIREHATTKLRGIQCHATQLDQRGRFGGNAEQAAEEPWLRNETFVLARSTVGWPDDIETDLLARLR